MLVPSFTEFPMTRSVFPVVTGDHVGAATRAQVGGAGLNGFAPRSRPYNWPQSSLDCFAFEEVRIRLGSPMRGRKMLRMIEVEIDESGRVRPLESAGKLPAGRALLTLLTPAQDETLALAEAALAEDWLRPEEDAAWAHLQPGR
jgi:hypothetical protein